MTPTEVIEQLGPIALWKHEGKYMAARLDGNRIGRAIWNPQETPEAALEALVRESKTPAPSVSYGGTRIV